MKPNEKVSIRTILERDPRVLIGYLFGSQVSGSANPMSDVDVAVLANQPLSMKERLDLQSRLSDALGTNAIDLVDLFAAPPLLRYEIITQGELMVSRNAEKLNDFERRVYLQYFDTQHLRDIQNNYLRHHLKAS